LAAARLPQPFCFPNVTFIALNAIPQPSNVIVKEQEPTPISQTGWLSWKQVPLLLLIIPIGFLLGFHIWFLAILTRKLTRVPYWIAMPILYGILTIPIWIYQSQHYIVLAIGTAFVILASFLPKVFDDDDGIMNGGNLEHSALAHIILIMFYLLIPALEAATEAHRRIQEQQNNGMDAKGSVGRF
jgi:hypothetical protein